MNRTHLAATICRGAQTQFIRAIVGLAALLAYTGVVLADPGTGSTIMPMQSDDFCSTEAGDMIDTVIGLVVIVFFAGILVAIFVAGSIEANPMTGWWNQVGYSMMGKIPVAVIFVVVMISAVELMFGSVGVDVPSCIPILG